MSVTSDPKEERAYARAFAALVEHVGPCGDCAEQVRSVQSYAVGDSVRVDPKMKKSIPVAVAGKRATVRKVGNESSARNVLVAVEGVEEEVWLADIFLEKLTIVLDLSDPRTPLCSKGLALRGKAVVAREATPSERLVAFYGLESPDVPPADAHDAARGVTWLRGDPGEARVILTQLVDRAGPLEERETPTAALREGFLKGFRQRFPSRGAAPSVEQKTKRAEAADRIVALVCDRYEKRHGAPPSVAVIEAFRKTYDVWVMGDGAGDLERMADDAEKFRASHARRWSLKALLKPKDPLDELKKIARWIAESLIEGEAALG